MNKFEQVGQGAGLNWGVQVNKFEQVSGGGAVLNQRGFQVNKFEQVSQGAGLNQRGFQVNKFEQVHSDDTFLQTVWVVNINTED